MKDTYYFPHDYHAIKDPKCSALIKDFGMTGYGLYWCIIEIMHEQGGKLKKFPKLIEGIAFELRVETKQLQKQIEAMIQEYNLLQEDDNFIWSNRVLKNLEERQKKYLIKAEAGRLGGIKSGKSRRIMKQNEAVLEANELKERKGKERKGKERKGNKNKVFIPPTLQEVKNYFLENGYSVEAAETAFNYYQVADWHDSKGNKIKNWKQKMHGVWFKDEHKIPGRKETHAEKIRRINPYGEKFENNG